MSKEHLYETTVEWTGNKGKGTADYRAYKRDHVVSVENKADILASSDPAFCGDKTRYNPEEMLVASLSSCHMLWYLHLCAEEGVVVTGYTDVAKGIMVEEDGGGRFKEVTLRPTIRVSDASMIEKAHQLHSRANALCFIANSVNFPVNHQPIVVTDQVDSGSTKLPEE